MHHDHRIKTISIFLITGILLSVCFFKIIIRKAVINFDLETEARTTLKVYWATGKEPYSEENMSAIFLTPGIRHYAVRICDIGKITRLRIDTSDERISKVTLRKISIYQNGYPRIVFSDKASFAKLTAVRGIEELRKDKKGLTVVPADNDPQLEYPLPHLSYSPAYIQIIATIFGIFIVVGLLYSATHILWKHDDFVPYLLFFILALVIAMAGISRYNLHPDEFVHIYAAEYYENHILPPKVCSPEIRRTYSQYGDSRLDSGEPVYLLAGKFLKLLKPFHIADFLVLRLFNVLLFSLLFFLALHRHVFRVLLLPILMSPQIWYVFSYFNSDAFNLFLSLLAAYQLVAEKSMFNRVLEEKLCGKNIFYFFCIAVLFGIMLISKLNFYFFLVFIFFYLLWKIAFKEIRLQRSHLIKISALAIAGVVIVGVIKSGDFYVNGLNKAAKIEACREKTAVHLYNPKTPLKEKYAYLQMKERGVTLKSLFTLDHWGMKSFASSFGVYGYTSVLASFTFYDLVAWAGLGFLAVLILSTLFKGGLKGNALLGITLFCAMTLIAMSLYHSWTADFQPQGRYFLPIVAMLSVCLFHNKKYLIEPLSYLFIVAMFLLSAYSFIFVGLYGIQKYFI